ncbi:hypothetical protein M5K25_000163 [Dendrobium thyrsiflorum]|uniref:Ubiquitin-like-conjugating enzyme ATG10 n=1 Tax=Dendrobium thyrsiflorum TaxID=117978 RepID=A0ABD0VTP0_DENTH
MDLSPQMIFILPQSHFVNCGRVQILLFQIGLGYLLKGYLLVFHEGYLSLENVYHIKSSKELVSSQDLFQEEQPVDSATMVHVPSSVIHAYDFHIIYSFSYRNPVLYFHGHKSDGQPLDLDDIQKDLPEYSLKLIRESKWTFITFEEHPYLHRPWYMLHPCGTTEWMKLLLQGNPSAPNYLVSWLSVVGQAVGLRVPSSLTTSCFNDGSSSSIGQCSI